MEMKTRNLLKKKLQLLWRETENDFRINMVQWSTGDPAGTAQSTICHLQATITDFLVRFTIANIFQLNRKKIN